MRLRRVVVSGLGGAALASAGIVGTSPGAAGAEPKWAPAATATIHPGVMTVSEAGQCTANFVFTDAADSTNVYIGQAAHCTSTGGPTDLDGCSAGSLPLGTPVAIEGASKPGILAYNSWLAMQARGETDPDACIFNDFALVRIDPVDIGTVNPSVPHWGGPVQGTSPGTSLGERVYSYGNSSLRLGLGLLSPKTGLSLGDSADGWTHTVLTVTPGIPGDSGSAYLDSAGRALGMLSTVQVAPVPTANGVGDLRRALAYLHASGGDNIRLALGTEPFTPRRLPLGPLAPLVPLGVG